MSLFPPVSQFLFPFFLLALIIAVLLVLFCAPSAWITCTRGFRRCIRWFQARLRTRSDKTSGGFDALQSIASDMHVNRSQQVYERHTQPLNTISPLPASLQPTSGQVIGQRVQLLSGPVPAPVTIATSTDIDITPSQRCPSIIVTPLPIPSTPVAPRVNTAMGPETSVAYSPGPPIQPRSLPSSNAPNISAQSPNDDSTRDTSIQTVPRMITTRASLRLEPIRIEPSPTPSVDVGSITSDRSPAPSLAEFPIPPPRSLTPLMTARSSRSYPPHDLGDARNLQSPTLPLDHHHNTAVTEEGPTSLDSDQAGPGHFPPSATSTRPPTYYGSWHHLTPSQSSFSTLPAYPGDEDGRLSQMSRAPTYRSSTSTLRGPRTPRVQPPLPVPPLPSIPLK